MNRTEPLKILVVDDEFIVRQTLKAYFDHLGHQVLEAGSGEFGLKALENHSFDAVVADMGMPGMDGVAFLKKCRETYPDMPVFLVSGKGGRSTRTGSGRGRRDRLFEKAFPDQRYSKLGRSDSPGRRAPGTEGFGPMQKNDLNQKFEGEEDDYKIVFDFWNAANAGSAGFGLRDAGFERIGSFADDARGLGAHRWSRPAKPPTSWTTGRP